MDGITLQGVFSKATTTVDGGWNVTFQCDQSQAQAILQLSSLRQTFLQIGLVPVDGASADSSDPLAYLDEEGAR